jgi:hypothetical protein
MGDNRNMANNDLYPANENESDKQVNLDKDTQNSTVPPQSPQPPQAPQSPVPPQHDQNQGWGNWGDNHGHPHQAPQGAHNPYAPPVDPQQHHNPYAAPNQHQQHGQNNNWGTPQPAYQQPYGQGPSSVSYGAPNGYNPNNRKTNVLAIASLVSGIGAIFVPILASIAAIILGHMSLNQIKQRNEEGKGMAIAGLILGYVGIGLGLLYVLFFGLIVLAGFHDSSGWNY